MMTHATHYEAKVWGETALVLQQPLFSVHHLRIRPHAWCSIHRHEHRINAFHVISGKLEVTLWQPTAGLSGMSSPCETVRLQAGEGMRVPPRCWHQFATKDQPAEVLEIYFPVTPMDADIERRTEGGRLAMSRAIEGESDATPHQRTKRTAGRTMMPKISDEDLRDLAADRYGYYDPATVQNMARELLAARPAVEALRELCRLKLLKEAAGATPEYERDKPAAWAAAMTAVAAFDEGGIGVSDESAGQAPPENDAEHEARLMRFYAVDTRAELLRAMERHITKLQAQVRRPLGDAYRHVLREG